MLFLDAAGGMALGYRGSASGCRGLTTQRRKDASEPEVFWATSSLAIPALILCVNKRVSMTAENTEQATKKTNPWTERIQALRNVPPGAEHSLGVRQGGGHVGADSPRGGCHC